MLAAMVDLTSARKVVRKLKDNQMSTKKFLTRNQVADRMQVSLVKLDRMRREGNAPPDVKIGRAIRFSEDGFNRWFAEQTATTTRKGNDQRTAKLRDAKPRGSKIKTAKARGIERAAHFGPLRMR